MSSELRDNIRQIKEIVRELHIFSNQFEVIKNLDGDERVYVGKEEAILEDTIISLTNQLKILNKTTPDLLERISLYSKLSAPTKTIDKKLMKINYRPEEKEQVSLVITEEDRAKFLENLSRSRLSIQKLKKKHTIEKPVSGLGKANFYAKISNKFFRNFSKQLIAKGYFKKLNRNLRKINSRFVLGTYVSMILLTTIISFIASLFLFGFLLFFSIVPTFPFIGLVEGSIFIRFFKISWILFAIPIVSGALVYFYPSTEARNLGGKINQELPFVTIHMSAIASSGVEPTNIFKIILKGEEYKYTNIEFRKLMNLINFHGEDIVSALQKVAIRSSSSKLRELFNGFAVTITSGGDLRQFLSERAENMLFDYKLERERYNKVSETFMDIYISIAIAAPMIFLMIFVIIGSTGMLGNIFGLSTNALSTLLILVLILLNIFFLLFLRVKQPAM